MKKIDKKDLLVIFAFTFIFLIGFVTEHFASDTYFFQIGGFDANASVYLSAGRLVMVLFLKVMKWLSFDFYVVKTISLLLAMISLSLATFILKRLIDKFQHNNKINTIISLLIIINIFVIELFTFTEYTGIMCFGIMCSVIAAYDFISYMDDKNKIKIILAFFMMLLSMLSYQGVVSLFICISSIFLVKYSSNVKSFLKYNILMGLIYGMPAIVGFSLTRLYGSSRTSIADNDLGTSFFNILMGLKNLLISTANVMPKYLFATLIVLLIIITITHFIKNKKWTSLLFFIYVLFMSLFFTVLPQFMVGTNMIWVMGRSNIALGSLVGLIILFYYLYSKHTAGTIKIIILISFVMFVFQYIGWQQIMKDHYIVNALDKNYATFIIENIKEYELKSDKKIKYINYFNDINTSFVYPDTVFYGDINVRVMSSDWARKYVIDYYAGTNYMTSTSKSIEEYHKYCLTRNWDHYSAEQLKFDGDTLNVCVY